MNVLENFKSLLFVIILLVSDASVRRGTPDTGRFSGSRKSVEPYVMHMHNVHIQMHISAIQLHFSLAQVRITSKILVDF